MAKTRNFEAKINYVYFYATHIDLNLTYFAKLISHINCNLMVIF
jgi:hypothetical protein